jgi:RHS repeat-associated protein
MQIGSRRSDPGSADADLTAISRIGSEPPPSANTGAAAFPGVDGATGRLSLAFPLPSAPARGTAPDLTLTYSSAGGTSAFGEGWTVPFSFIGPDLKARYPLWDGTDDMVLDGGETMVPEMAGAEPVATEASIGGTNYSVTRFRPRIDAALDRIERWTRADDGDVHWRILRGDGTVDVYGQSPAARLADPEAPDRVVRWMIERGYDPAGNVTHFSYDRDIRQSGDDPAGLTGGAASAGIYPKTVSFGAVAPYDPETEVLPDFFFQTTFDYGDHDPDDPGPVPDRPAQLHPGPSCDRTGGFPVTLTRLCRRILHFRRFPELGPLPRLTDALELTHDSDDGPPLLTALRAVRFAPHTGGGLDRAALPAQRFGYAPFAHDVKVTVVAGEAGDGGDLRDNAVPTSSRSSRRFWADLRGEALPGLLVVHPGGASFARNLGGGRLAAALPLDPAPDLAGLGAGSVTIEDVEGTGLLALAIRRPGQEGYHPLTADGGAGPFRPFRSRAVLPRVEGTAVPVDLDGDGRTDVLLIGGGPAVWLPGLGAEGVDAPREVTGAGAGPAHALRLHADRSLAVLMADLSGDGLADLAIIGAGAVRVLPGLGRGRFGSEVRMRDVPEFLSAPDFDARRLCLADLDGIGAAGLVYAAGDAVLYARNRGGRGFHPARTIPIDAEHGPVDSVTAVDLMGSGTDALVWTAARTGELRFLAPAGPLRPHLLVSHATGAGIETAIGYGTGASESAAALREGRPWRSSVPFPLEVVTRIETEDRLSGARDVRRYAYAHPFYDPVEREFRGFARVETRDTDAADEAALRAGQVGPFLDPTLIERTWFDVGAPVGHALSPAAISGEWWAGDADLRPDIPADLPGAGGAARARARTGAVLRVERWAADRHAAPLVVETRTLSLIEVQGGAGPRPPVLRTYPREAVKATFEGNPSDPFVQQTLTLAADDQGFVTEAATLSRGRAATDPALPPEVQAEQARTHCVIERTALTDDSASLAPRRFLLRRPWRRTVLALDGFSPPAGRLPRPDDIRLAAAAAATVAFETPRGPGVTLRRVGESRDRFLDDDLAGELPFGTLGALPGVARRYTLALTPSLRVAVYGPILDDAERDALGYVDLDADGTWWLRSGRTIPGPDALGRFHLPTAVEDSAGRRTTLAYDPHALVVVGETDPIGNTASRRIDYRLFATVEMTDANGDRVGIAHDVSGVEVARALLGRDPALTGGAAEGDTMEDPTERFAHDLTAWEEGRGPTSIRHERRETHGDPASRWMVTVTYLDGRGAPLQTFTKAAPGAADAAGPGGVAAAAADPRFRVSPRERLSNKGRAASGFHPWFAAGTAFVDDHLLTQRGRGPVTCVDALGRTLRVDRPDGTFARTAYRAWVTVAEDANDTALESDWYDAAGRPDPSAAPPADPVGWTAWATAAHAGTPDEAHVDAAGAPLFDRVGHRSLRTERSPGGHATRARDGAGRLVSETLADLAGRPMSTRAMEDRGPTRIVLDAAGRARRIHRPDGHVWTLSEDAAGRPVGVTLTPPGGGAPRTLALTVWGESHPEAALRRLRGRARAMLDESGVTLFEGFDLHGVPTAATKRFTPADAQPDWAALVGLAAPAAEAAAAPLLEAEGFTTRTLATDAFGRALATEGPDGTRTMQAFDAGGLLARLEVQPGGAGPVRIVINGQAVDAWGALVAQRRGDGVTLSREIDPDTRRVRRLRAVRAADGLAILDAAYTYDPVGHITRVMDAATPTLYFDNAAVSGDMTFRYDGLHQLVEATGRELAALNPPSWAAVARTGLPHANDAAAVRRYTQSYAYDEAGNLTEIAHRAGPAGWRRRLRYAPGTNRLEAVSQPGDPDGVHSLAVVMDADGRTTTMPGVADALSWTASGQLSGAELGGGGTASYIHAGGGARARKIVRRPGGVTEETLYLGALEIRRRRVAGALVEDRRTILVRSGEDLVARIDRQVLPAGGAALLRFRLRDETGLLGADTDAAGALVAAETFHPFGTTAWRASTNDAESALARYRWADRATDDETGLVPMGLRLYAPWLGRWISPDPAGATDGPNLYAFAGNDPVNLRDPSGMKGEARSIPGVGSDPSKWTWKEMTKAAEYFGFQLIPEVNAGNYKNFWNPSTRKWMVVLVKPDAPDATDEKPGSDGAAGDNTDAKPPPDAEAKAAAGDGGAAPAGAAPAGSGPGGSAPAAPEPAAAVAGGEAKSGASVADVINPGASAVNAYNSHQRGLYAKGNVERAIKAVADVEAAVRAGDEASAWEIAEKASNERNAARIESQKKIKLTGGQQLSELLDRKMTPDGFRAKYGSGTNKPMGRADRLAWKVMTPGLPEHVPGPRGGSLGGIARDVAIGSGKTNRMMSGLSKVGKPLGIIGTAIGVGVGVHRYVNAAPEQQKRVAGEEIGAFIGGAAGFALGTALVGAALLAVAAVFTAPAWLAVAATFAVGAAFAYVFSEIGSSIGGAIADLF